MTRPSSQIYRTRLPDLPRQLITAIDKGCQRSTTPPVVFFRADDIGIPSRQFSQLIEIFHRHRMPLCLATVPGWLTPERYKELKILTGNSKEQWCWHQHGYVHRNFEPKTMKKQEFGPGVSATGAMNITARLLRGKKRLDNILGDHNQPVFTPPWNRCSKDTLDALQQLGFKAVSRSLRAKPPTTRAFPDFQVSVDLHTRKEATAEEGLHKLLAEIEEGLTLDRCGIMLHHQRMNGRAVALLDTLLSCLKQAPQISFVHFGDLL
ncbi:DUF2334 domain-containing protein [Desulforhopalus sp. IMCC35007]|uniref:DUF2334 domain-containing protein n=1 Tax=Desulforhopalus sp. IMCC35007 TaxID=2569543 RepID=UPI0010ADD6FA|nr:DUF2334 domain-containing protein [Desulforhopalus sp. IMCC35007]TKB06328.1 hypothetical protein FCL48_21475 [Desulforhopalus sp. IMCC35007]